MLTVGEDAAEVERRLVAGGLVCPVCGDVLVGWGHARRRVIRGESGRVWVLPRRARCCGCHVTHVLLPVAVLLRRGDGVAVIGAALAGKAAGSGARPIAAALQRPLGTVRGWLTRFGSRIEAIRGWFTRLLCEVALDPVPPAPAGSVWADALAAVTAGVGGGGGPVGVCRGAGGGGGCAGGPGAGGGPGGGVWVLPTPSGLGRP